MTSALLKLLTLLALLCMSFGMANAPAVGQPAPAHDGMAATGHCDEQRSDQDKAPESKMDCVAMCASLAAADGPGLPPALIPKALNTASQVTPFAGVLLEIATPPPRHV